MSTLAKLRRMTSPKVAVVLVALALVAGTLLLLRDPAATKTVTAHFPRAVSVYKGTDVRVLGVNVGKVTAVVPEGNSVRVEIEYDAEVDVPADAQAMVVTPTLVADRFVQLGPVYTEGPVMADGADIALPDSAVPVELDRIYASLRDLSAALGPNGVNADGTLNHLLEAGANALDGRGELGNEMIRNLSAASQTFGEGAGPLFDTVEELATFTQTLAANDELVRAFIQDLAGVSSDLVDEREEIAQAIAAVADSVGTVKTFVRTNRQALVTDLEKLTRTMKTINSERASLDTALDVAPVAMSNLVLAYDSQSGSIGSRIGVQGNVADLDGFLCALVQQSSMAQVSKDLACTIFEQLLEPVTTQIPPPLGVGRQAEAREQGTGDTGGTSSAHGGGAQGAGKAGGAGAARTQTTYASDDDPTLAGLLGGGS